MTQPMPTEPTPPATAGPQYAAQPAPQHYTPPAQYGAQPYGPPPYQESWGQPVHAPMYVPLPQQQVNVINGGFAGYRRTSHGLHLFLSIVTMGLWVPVWIIVTVVNRYG